MFPSHDREGTLFFEIARIVEAKKPKCVLLENVKGLLSHDDGRTFKTILSTINELGYDSETMVLDSFDFGYTKRERVFIVAYLRDDENYIRKREKQDAPIHSKCSERARAVGQEIGKETSRISARTVRAFARLPEWLDSWDTFYPKEKVSGKRCDCECD